MKPELVRFTDGIYLIVDEEIDAYDDDAKKGIFTPIDSVKHWWIRYEFIGEYNCPDDYDDPEPGDSMWLLYERETRPKGVVRKATAINE
jgi:hypothetical protein